MLHIVDFANFAVKAPRELVDEPSNCGTRKPVRPRQDSGAGAAGAAAAPKPTRAQLSQDYGLNLCSCDLTSLDGLAELAEASLWAPERLVYLDLSGNKLASLQGIEAFPNLRVLYVQGNQIDDVRSLACLQSSSVDSLAIGGNPLVAQEFHRQWILVHLPRVKRLDKQSITPSEREDAVNLDKLRGITLRRRQNVVVK